MNSKTSSIAPVLRGDENGVHRAAVQLKPGDVWYDTDTINRIIYVLLSTAPWTFLIVHREGLGPTLWSPRLGTEENYILNLFRIGAVFVPAGDQ